MKDGIYHCMIPLYSLSMEEALYSDKEKEIAHVPYLENELKIDRYKYKEIFDDDVQGNTCAGIYEDVAIVQIQIK